MIRPPAEDELRFVRSGWLESYSTSDFARFLTPPPQWEQRKYGGQLYFDSQRRLIEAILASTSVLVSEGDGVLDGFVVGQPGRRLDYVYVKKRARGQGVARTLLEALDLVPGKHVVYTHRARGARGQPRAWVFDPSPTTLLEHLMADPKNESRRRRVRKVQFVESISVRGGASGERLQRTFLRAEEDRSRVFFDPVTSVLTVYDEEVDGTMHEHVVSIVSCRDVVLYPPGEGPAWEKPASAPAALPEKGAAA